MARVFVDGRAVLDQRIHVRNGHTNPDFVSGQGLGDRELIQVEGVIVINGGPWEVRQVTNPRGLSDRLPLCAGGHSNLVQFGKCCGRKVRQ